MAGYAIIRRQLDDNVIVGFEAYNLQGGQYKLMFNRELGGFCEIIWQDSLKEEAENFLKQSNLTFKHGDCPIQPTVFTLNNYSPDNLGDYLPAYVPGNERWKLTVFTEENGKRTTELDFYTILSDEKSIMSSIASGRK
jgi:hypothetical protein